MAKSDKLYSKSPSIERDSDSGKVGVKKPTKADGEDMGIEGPANPNNPDPAMPVQVHQTHEEAVQEMHSRHEQELKDMHKRHMSDVSALRDKLTKKQSAEEEVSLDNPSSSSDKG